MDWNELSSLDLFAVREDDDDDDDDNDNNSNSLWCKLKPI